jgi:hypothetical protein
VADAAASALAEPGMKEVDGLRGRAWTGAAGNEGLVSHELETSGQGAGRGWQPSERTW